MENKALNRKERNEKFFNSKNSMRQNPSSILILAQEYEGYALLKIALQVDKYTGLLRTRSRPTDQSWEAVSVAVNRTSVIMEDIKEAVDAARRQKGNVSIIQDIAIKMAEEKGEELVMREKFCFVIVPRSPDGGKLYGSILRLDEILHAYRQNHLDMALIGTVVSKTIEIMQTLNEHAGDLAKLAGEPYVAAYPVRNVLFGEKPAIVDAGSAGSEIAQAKEDVSGKKKHKARKDLASEESDNIGPQVTGTEAVAG